MKNRLPIIFAIISAFILCGLIIAGLISPGSRTDRGRRLFRLSAEAENGETAEEPERAAARPVKTDTVPEAETRTEGPAAAAEEEAPGLTSEEGEIPVEEAVLDERTPLDKYTNLLEINPFVSGWLRIDDSSIDGPVVYTPKSQNYFLHRAPDGSDDEKGTFFIAVNWQEGYHQTLIYGHNMRDGSSFGSLEKYAKEKYWQSHPVIHFDTLYEEREYQVFAAFYSQIEEEELETEEDRAEADKAIEEESIAKKEEEGESVESAELTLKDMDLYEDFGDVDIYRTEKDEDNGRFRYYYYTDLSDKADFDYFVQNVKERELYDTGVVPEWGDELITLSTCSYHVKNGRFIVAGVRKASSGE